MNTWIIQQGVWQCGEVRQLTEEVCMESIDLTASTTNQHKDRATYTHPRIYQLPELHDTHRL